MTVPKEAATKTEVEATKPGWQSSEFWSKIVAYIVPLVPIFVTIFRLPGEDTERITQLVTGFITSVGLAVVTVGGAIMYARERTKAKVKMMELVAMREGATVSTNVMTGERMIAMSPTNGGNTA